MLTLGRSVLDILFITGVVVSSPISGTPAVAKQRYPDDGTGIVEPAASPLRQGTGTLTDSMPETVNSRAAARRWHHETIHRP